MDPRVFWSAVLLICVIIVSGAILYRINRYENINEGVDSSQSESNNDQMLDIVKNEMVGSQPVDLVIERAEPYISQISYENIDLRTRAASIVKSCPSGDKECQVNGIYRHVVDNFLYFSDPRNREFVQSPSDTLRVEGGDCEDLSILLNSFLENLGIKTYLVLADNHAYSLACGIDDDKLWEYIRQSLTEKVAKDFSRDGQFETLISDGNLYLVSKKSASIQMDAGQLFYYGGNGSKLEEPFISNNMRYNIESSQPLTIYVVPSKDDYDLIGAGESFRHYPDCKKENVFRASDICERLPTHGGIVLVNENWAAAFVDYELEFQTLYSLSDYFQDKNVTYYDIQNQKCIVLDATMGQYGYPGFDGNLAGEKIAVDPVTREYFYLA